VRVVNAPFRIEATPPAEAVPFYMQPWVQDLLRAGAAPARWPWWRWWWCSR
jgi:hypothetical protein